MIEPRPRRSASRRSSAYTRLGDLLASYPRDQHEAVLHFAAIERVLGRALPRSSQHVSFWTARSQTGIGRALRRAGFHADLIVDQDGPAVRFTRRPPEPRLPRARDTHPVPSPPAGAPEY